MMRQSLNPFRDRHYVLTTSHSVEECRRRLLQEVQPTIRWIDINLTYNLGSDQRPVFGRVEERRFTIRSFHFADIRVGNASVSSIVANGRLVPTEDGAEVRLSLGMSRYGKISAVPAVAVAIGCAIVLALNIAFPPVDGLVVFFTTFLSLPAVFLILGRWRSHKRATELMGFLTDLLDAECARAEHSG
jgi:hypothetical protein